MCVCVCFRHIRMIQTSAFWLLPVSEKSANSEKKWQEIVQESSSLTSRWNDNTTHVCFLNVLATTVEHLGHSITISVCYRNDHVLPISNVGWTFRKAWPRLGVLFYTVMTATNKTFQQEFSLGLMYVRRFELMCSRRPLANAFFFFSKYIRVSLNYKTYSYIHCIVYTRYCVSDAIGVIRSTFIHESI